MTADQDFDDLLRAWVDISDERLPANYLRGALDEIGTTRQRRTAPAWLEDIIMRFQPLALPLAIAAAMVVVVAGGLAIINGPPPAGGSPSPAASAEVPSTPSPITADQLDAITLQAGDEVMGEKNGLAAILGLSKSQLAAGESALTSGPGAGIEGVDGAGFVDGRFVEFSGPLSNDPRTRATIWTYALLFESAEDAERVYGSLIDAHEAPDGWDLQPGSTRLELGDEQVYYTGQAYERGEATIYLWRDRNAVLAAIGVEGTDAALLIDVASRMSRMADARNP